MEIRERSDIAGMPPRPHVQSQQVPPDPVLVDRVRGKTIPAVTRSTARHERIEVSAERRWSRDEKCREIPTALNADGDGATPNLRATDHNPGTIRISSGASQIVERQPSHLAT
jgi:hypothetical protein